MTSTIDQAIDLLNEALKTDPDAINALFNVTVPCNAELANHPTIQVRAFPGEDFRVGIMGILNGIFCDPKTSTFIGINVILADPDNPNSSSNEYKITRFYKMKLPNP